VFPFACQGARFAAAGADVDLAGGDPGPAQQSEIDGHNGEIVGLCFCAAEFADRSYDVGDKLPDWQLAVGDQRIAKALPAVELATARPGLGKAVGNQNQA